MTDYHRRDELGKYAYAYESVMILSLSPVLMVFSFQYTPVMSSSHFEGLHNEMPD